MTQTALDITAGEAAEAEAFAEGVADILNKAAVAVMMSIGHRTGLFDRMAELPPAPSARIARAAGLDERYVREWLAVMVTGGIVDYAPEGSLYHLPPARAASITREGALGNLAVYAQSVAMLGAMEERLLRCFATGEGTRYGDYPCFHQIMAEDSAQTVTASLFDTILPLADGLQDRLAAGIEVLDAGCGRGSALIAMAQRYPASRFTGYDLCADAIGHAAGEAARRGLANIRFETRDLSAFAEVARYDFIASFDAVHDQKDPRDFLHRLHRALRPGGVHLMQDIGGSARLERNIDFPMASLLYAISCGHCMAVSLGQGGKGLGTMWGWETAEAMLREAGYRRIARHVLEHDPLNVWFVSQKG